MTAPPPPTPKKKQSSQIVLIIAIVAVVATAALAIPQIRHAIFGGGAASAPANAPVLAADGTVKAPVIPPAPKKFIVEQPRANMPMGQDTSFFSRGKAWPFQQEEKAGIRVQYYYLWTPPAADASAKYPLVIFLHDEEGMAPGAATLIATREMQAAFPAFIVVPQIPKTKTWAYPAKFAGSEFGNNKREQALATAAKWPADKQALHDVMVLTSQLIGRYNIDLDRIYIVGCGEGGTGVYGAISQYPQYFAGAIAINGLWSFNDAARMGAVPTLVLHGGADKVTDPFVAQGFSQMLSGRGKKQFYYTPIPDLAHRCDDPRLFTPQIWKWLLSLRKPPEPAELLQPTEPDAGMQAPAHP